MLSLVCYVGQDGLLLAARNVIAYSYIPGYSVNNAVNALVDRILLFNVLRSTGRLVTVAIA